MPDSQLNPSEAPDSGAQLLNTVTYEQEPTWQQKLLALLGVIFCFEMGVFLLIFPWVSEWDLNYFSRLPFQVRDIWVSPYFRGAISGIGVLNVYISIVEVFRLRRFSS